jgi:hypothetical protein
MKKIFLLTTLALNSIIINAQFDLEWVKTLKNTQTLFLSQGIETRVIEAGTNNDVYIAGWFSGTMDFDPSATNYFLTPLYNYSGFIAKYNSSGTLIWVKQFDEVTGNYALYINDLVIDNFENIYITGCQGVGSKIDFDPSPNTYYDSSSNTRKLFIAKYNSNGDFVWEKNIGNVFSVGVDLFLDDDNNIYIGGQGHQNYDRNCIIKFDNMGNLIWHKTVTSDNSNAYGSMYVSSNGDIYITGRGSNVDMDLGPATNILQGYAIMFLGKYDSNGNLIWAKKINTSMLQTSITVDVNGNVFTAGKSGPPTSSPHVITKWSNNGTLLLLYNTPPNLTIDNMAINCSNNLLISGFYDHSSNNFDFLGGNFSIPTQGSNFGGYNLYIACYNTNDLSINWAKGLQGYFWPVPVTNTAGDFNNNCTKYVDIKKSNNFYVASTFSGTSDVDPNSSATLINPVTNTYNDIFFAKYSGCNNIGLGELENNKLSNVFPNPNNGVFTISNLKPNVIIEILDLAGRSIYKTQVKNEKITIQLNNLEKGIYIYTITDKQGFLQSGKVIVQ